MIDRQQHDFARATAAAAIVGVSGRLSSKLKYIRRLAIITGLGSVGLSVVGLRLGVCSVWTRARRARTGPTRVISLGNVQIDDAEGQRDGADAVKTCGSDDSARTRPAAETCRPTPAGTSRRSGASRPAGRRAAAGSGNTTSTACGCRGCAAGRTRGSPGGRRAAARAAISASARSGSATLRMPKAIVARVAATRRRAECASHRRAPAGCAASSPSAAHLARARGAASRRRSRRRRPTRPARAGRSRSRGRRCRCTGRARARRGGSASASTARSRQRRSRPALSTWLSRS